MSKKNRFALFILLFSGAALLLLLLFLNRHSAVLNPQGSIAAKERHLIITSTILMLIVVIPVYIMTFTIAWKYRAGNKKAKYSPDWDGHRLIELSWWVVPGIIISVLAVITWRSSHELDPFRSLSSDIKPMTIQVVSLQWKWLFIYPEQNIASVNTAHIPTSTPVDFEITSDAPMNSFWIPQLGGQIYAMSGMATHLHLTANQVGTYRGSSANISGRGFAAMNFTVIVTNQTSFGQWVQSVKQASNRLSSDEYNLLSRPSENQQIMYYASAEKDIFEQIISKYRSPLEGITEAGHNHASKY